MERIIANGSRALLSIPNSPSWLLPYILARYKCMSGTLCGMYEVLPGEQMELANGHARSVICQKLVLSRLTDALQLHDTMNTMVRCPLRYKGTV